MKTKDQTTSTTVEPATEAERFRDFVKQVVSVPKEEIDKREIEYQNQRTKVKAQKKTAKTA